MRHISNFEKPLNENQEEYSLIDIEKATERILENKSSKRLTEESFSDIYTEEEIKRDLKMVETMEEKFQKDNEHISPNEREKVLLRQKRSEALEIITDSQIELNNWFGENAMVVRTSRFDDIFNGVDTVVEFDTETKERIALAVDASMSSNLSIIKDKIRKNVEKVLNENKSAEVKYFESQIDETKGKLEMVVPAVIGLEGKNTNKLIMNFGELLKLKRLPKEDKTEIIKQKIKEKKEEIINHPAQKIFLEEIIIQLEMYSDLLEERKDDYALKYKKEIINLSKIIGEVLDSKQNIQSKELENDGVFEAIKTTSAEF